MKAKRTQFDTEKTIAAHSNAMEGLRRATAGAYDPNAKADFDKPFTFFDGADVISKGQGPGAKYFKNNVRVRANYEKSK